MLNNSVIKDLSLLYNVTDTDRKAFNIFKKIYYNTQKMDIADALKERKMWNIYFNFSKKELLALEQSYNNYILFGRICDVFLDFFLCANLF